MSDDLDNANEYKLDGRGVIAMNIIIVGGGKVGYHLMKSLRYKNEMTLIEKQLKVCEKIAEEFDGEVILCGDGTSLEVLNDAGISQADVVIASTGKDEENLIICQIAKMNFGVAKTIARVNNPKNIEVFKELGVDKTVCSTAVIANMLEQSFN